MSIQTWKDEFYPVPADRVAKEDAVNHGLQKYLGLLPHNLAKHGITLHTIHGIIKSIVVAGEYLQVLGVGNCALCTHYREDNCRGCPLNTPKGTCYEEGQPYNVLEDTGNSAPLIAALSEAAYREGKVHEEQEKLDV